eukprot:m.72097 g.72097  ORF g.72097 m.72097 type:complete len:455 (+) comp14232_c0_seq4:189-1553(+)
MAVRFVRWRVGQSDRKAWRGAPPPQLVYSMVPRFVSKVELARGQNPTMFALPGLSAAAFWPSLGRGPGMDDVVAAAQRDAARLPFSRYVDTIERAYLMEDGQTNHRRIARTQTEATCCALLHHDSACQGWFAEACLVIVPAGGPHTEACLPASSNVVLRCLVVLQGTSDAARAATLVVAGQEQVVAEGSPCVFDATFAHSLAYEQSDEPVVALLFDLWHPELTKEQQCRVFEGFDRCSDTFLMNTGTQRSTIHTHAPFVLEAICTQHLQVAVVGPSRAGKTQLINRLVHDEFSTKHRQSLGTDLSVKSLRFRFRHVQLQCLDTPASESAVAAHRYRHSVLVVFDASSTESLEEVKTVWLPHAKRLAEGPWVKIMLVAAKIDLQRAVSREEGEIVAHMAGVLYGECSSKTSAGIVACCVRLLQQAADDLHYRSVVVSPAPSPAQPVCNGTVCSVQ